MVWEEYITRVGEAPSLLGYTGVAPLLGYDISGEMKREVDRRASDTLTLLGFGERGGGNGTKQNARHCLVSSFWQPKPPWLFIWYEAANSKEVSLRAS
ncbi:hypothetical protein RHMOL_Rhmol13G0039500 [Rhododendron molle]|uniref:Uncharacterized protein n=1 Tax=Rhododendron molle TaxID=49168 RepID=A0ACC0L3N1_RHOML|nr:hypothetical protein RHMOL_Rhmol13G0039500 [Rhododendron molle]